MDYERIAPFYREQLATLLNNNKDIKIITNFKYPDRCLIKIPYCNKNLQWEVLFCGDQPSIPPDFIFEEGEEFFTTIDRVRSLQGWGANNPEGLHKIVMELLLLYKDYQKRMLQNFPSQKLQFELATIAEMDDAEFLLEREQMEFHCLVPIPLDLANGGKTPLKLHLVFSLTSDKIPERRLVFNSKSSWEGLLMSVKLPTWTTDMYTVTYFPLVKETVQAAFQEFLSRKKLIDALKATFGDPLEYDAYNYQKIAFVFEQSNFAFIAHISIPADYPSKSPFVTLTSVGHSKNNKPLQMVYNSCPYSPRWNYEELSRRLRDFIVEVVGDFKKLCNDEGDV